MSRLPRISVVTASYNQGPFIAETIESVLAQDYPDFEHIVVDGMSTDETPAVLARYKHLKVIREPDKGHADATNKGFRIATGDILCFLNSDDTLLPGAFHRVAREIDPARGRHIIMGRCRFIDEHGRYSGIEHPSHFESFARVLEIWKGHTIPQPAVFWTREVWTTCGPLELGLTHLDYDLFCRFAHRYQFHYVDQVLATYRLHSESKTMGWTEADRLADGIRLSKKYWGSPLLPLYWRLTLSLALFRFDRTGRARRHYHQGEDCARHGKSLPAFWHRSISALLAPDVVFYARIFPALKGVLRGRLARVLYRLVAGRQNAPETAVYMDRTETWADGWAGPRLIVKCHAFGGEHLLRLEGAVHTKYLAAPFVLTTRIDGRLIGETRIDNDGSFVRVLELPEPLQPGSYAVEILASAWVVYHNILHNGDHRPLAWLPAGVDGVKFQAV